MGRRSFLSILTLVASGIAVVAIFAVAPSAAHNRLVFGTFAGSGAPPRVDFCGRRYYPGRQSVGTLPPGLAVIDTAPSGMPVLANVMTAAEQSRYHTNICTMEVWVQAGPHSYLPYMLSGGP